MLRQQLSETLSASEDRHRLVATTDLMAAFGGRGKKWARDTWDK